MATVAVPTFTVNSKEASSRFKQNWLARNNNPAQSTMFNSGSGNGSSEGSNESNLDDSLTSLNWLQNLRIMRIQQPTPPSSPAPLTSAVQRLNTTITIQNHKSLGGILRVAKTTSEEAKAFNRISGHHHPANMDQIDYKTNQLVKPPYSYATLIWMALKASKKNKITLSAIYKWITENFKYYQTADPSWQNSIRHNLSLNKCFMKVARRKDEPGKGGFWQIDPKHADLLESGIFKKRRNSSKDFGTENIKRIKLEPVDDEYDECCLEDKHRCRKQSSPKKKKVPDLIRPLQLYSIGSSDGMSDSDDNLPSAVLKDDVGWNFIFQSEIDVEGIKVKTEDILNGEVNPYPSLRNSSPPPSKDEEDQGERVKEEVLDLSINGVHIPRPTWFDEQLKDMDFTATQETQMLLDEIDLPPSPDSSINDQQSHPWAEAGGPISFDVDDLLDFETPNGDMPWDLSLQSLPSP